MGKSWGGWAIKGVLTVGVLLILANTIDFTDVWTQLRAAESAWIFAAVLLFGAQLLTLALRLAAVTHADGGRLDALVAVRATMLCHAATQVLPSTVGGDAVRILVLTRAGEAVIDAVRRVTIDRLFGLAALALVVVLAAPGAVGLLPGVAPQQSWLVVASLVGLLVLAVAVSFAVSRRPNSMRRGLLSKLLDLVEQVWVGVVRLTRTPLVASLALALSVLSVCLYVAVFWTLARAVSLSLSPNFVLFVIPVAVIVMMAPITISGWGVREAVLVTALGFVDVPAAQALAASILFGAVPLLFGVLGLPFLMLQSGLRSDDAPKAAPNSLRA